MNKTKYKGRRITVEQGVKIYESPKGYAIDEDGKIKIYIYTMADYDGIKDEFTNETWIDYNTGLYQVWTSYKYFAKYYDEYEGNKEKALKVARRELGLK